MRSHGAKAADIALLVVSSVDGVMPQAQESIKLLKSTKTPFIVVLTKSDDLHKNPEKVKSCITITTPHQGTPVAYLGFLLKLFGTYSNSIEQMFPNSLFLEELNQEHIDKRIKYKKTRFVNILGTHDFVVPYQFAEFKNADIEHRLEGYGHVSILHSKELQSIIEEEIQKTDHKGPVVFLHGLCLNQSSFRNTRNNLNGTARPIDYDFTKAL